jgi:hypothetical protein
MPRIFISYRRKDSKWVTDEIYDGLKQRYGAKNVFRDVNAIPGGVNFRAEIERQLIDCDAMVVVIGKEWLTITDDSGNRRLDNPDDAVRIEIEMALRQNKVIIPVIVNGANVPSSNDLPLSIRQLSDINALFMHPDNDEPEFRVSIKKLIDLIDQKHYPAKLSRSTLFMLGGGIILIAFLAILLLLNQQMSTLTDNPTPSSQPDTDITDTSPATNTPSLTQIPSSTPEPSPTPGPSNTPSIPLSTSAPSDGTSNAPSVDEFLLTLQAQSSPTS